MAGLSLTEKLAVTGAFLALVAMAVGTKNDPGIVVTGTEGLAARRAAQPAPVIAPEPTAPATIAPSPEASPPPEPVTPPPAVVMQPPVDPPPEATALVPAPTGPDPAARGTVIVGGRPVT